MTQTKKLAEFAHGIWKLALQYEQGVVKKHPNKQMDHHCAVALFLAEQELPNGTEEERWTRALTILRSDLLGKGTTYEHLTRLKADRKNLAVDQRWGSWGMETIEQEGTLVDTEQAVDTTTTLEEFMDDLKAVLTEKEYALLERIYVQGTTRTQLVEEMVTAEPRYASPEGRKQAMNRVNVAIHRARKKAQLALPERWQAFATQVAV